jgi:hypothetical protein
LKQADEREREQNPQYYFRLLEPDFTPVPVYRALSDAARLPPLMYQGYHQEDHWAVSYAGWEQVKDERAVLGAYYHATMKDAQAHFTFDGSDLWLVLPWWSDGEWLEVRVDDGPPQAISRDEHLLRSTKHLNSDTSEIPFGVQVPVARGLAPGQHQVLITAQEGAAIDGYFVQDRPIWLLQRAVGAIAAAVGLVALGWLWVSQRHTGAGGEQR